MTLHSEHRRGIGNRSLESLLRWLTGATPERRRTYRPRLEALEERCQLAVTITEFSSGLSANSSPQYIAAGQDGNLWFTEGGGGAIGRITPLGTITEFSIPSSANPQRIAAGPDGNLWFTEPGADRIGRITFQGIITEFSTGISPGAEPAGIAAGPDGNVWFTENILSRIGRITPQGTVTEFSAGISPNSAPGGITAGPDGNLWFAEYSGRIGRITPQGTVTEFSTGITSGAGPDNITAGPDGNLWFTERQLGIGRITPQGVVTEFSTGISPNSSPDGITAGPDGNLWFAENDGSRIGRITPQGVVTEFSTGISPNSSPDGITTGPDGNLWFAEFTGNRIGRAVISDGPQVSASYYQIDGTPGFVIVFNRAIAGLDASDVDLKSLTTSQPIPNSQLAIDFSAGAAQPLIRYLGDSTGALPDGSYRITIPQGAFTDADGNPNVTAFTADFFSLAGDANHDRTVGFADLVAVAQHYGQTGGATWSMGDFNHDGNVGFADLVTVAQSYGKSLPAAGAALGAVVIAEALGTPAVAAAPAPRESSPSSPSPKPLPIRLSAKPPTSHRPLTQNGSRAPSKVTATVLGKAMFDVKAKTAAPPLAPVFSVKKIARKARPELLS